MLVIDSQSLFLFREETNNSLIVHPEVFSCVSLFHPIITFLSRYWLPIDYLYFHTWTSDSSILALIWIECCISLLQEFDQSSDEYDVFRCLIEFSVRSCMADPTVIVFGSMNLRIKLLDIMSYCCSVSDIWDRLWLNCMIISDVLPCWWSDICNWETFWWANVYSHSICFTLSASLSSPTFWFEKIWVNR